MIILRRYKKVEQTQWDNPSTNLPNRIVTSQDLTTTMHHFMGKYYSITYDKLQITISHKSPSLKKRFKEAEAYIKQHKTIGYNFIFKEPNE